MSSVNIPFPGFYESLYSQAVDHEESQFIEYHCDASNGESDADYEAAWPAELQLNESEYFDCLYKNSSYSAAYAKIAGWYVEAFDRMAGEALDMTRAAWRNRYVWETRKNVKERYRAPSIGLKFEEMTSPREYNFETDRLFVTIPSTVVREMFKRSKAEGHKTLAEIIRERHTSYDGFHSFYRNDLESWLEKPLAEWDHNELATLLQAALQLALAGDTDAESMRWELYESTMGDEGAYEAWSECVEWSKFEAARTEARLDKFRDWLESDEEAAKRWAAAHPDLAAIIGAEAAEVPPARDANTLDLFEGNDSHA